jgi:lipoate-protein ligase A
MKYVGLNWATPEANLAADEALLDYCDETGESGVLRVWESSSLFVVVGYANQVNREVKTEACRSRNVPVLRRCTGGGTVVQGPGCLNYTLVFRVDGAPPLASIRGTNAYVMDRHRQAIQGLCEGSVAVQGHTDLTLDGRKFSGNAQRRRRACVLFHGTFLLQFPLSLAEELLAYPSKAPEYRRNRPHHEFLTNLGLPGPRLADTLRRIWGASGPLTEIPYRAIDRLVAEKYSQRDWNLRL